MELRVATEHLRNLHEQLMAFSPSEGAAFLAVEPAAGSLVMRAFRVFGARELDSNTSSELALDEEAKVATLAEMKRLGHAAVEVHTHPGADEEVHFSPFDESELPAFARYVQLKLPGRPFGAFVFGRRSYNGRVFSGDEQEPLRLRAIGERRSSLDWLPEQNGKPASVDARRFDRQLRALGPAGQASLSTLRVGVVGLGGTGSQIIQQLAHLGVRDYVLIEDDRVEQSNLARLAGGKHWDAVFRRRKTAVARRTIRHLARRAAIRAPGTLRCEASLEALCAVDVIVGCVDNDGARLILSELAASHLVPYLDIGVGIEPDGESQAVGGRVGFYMPGGPCLACADELDFAEAAEDLESEGMRTIRIERGYARDRRIEPALMPLNTVLVGLAMVELLAFVTGLRRVVPFWRYDALQQRIVPINAAPEVDCPICQPAFGMGDRQMIRRYTLLARDPSPADFPV